jgi:hypothetical protein
MTTSARRVCTGHSRGSELWRAAPRRICSSPQRRSPGWCTSTLVPPHSPRPSPLWAYARHPAPCDPCHRPSSDAVTLGRAGGAHPRESPHRAHPRCRVQPRLATPRHATPRPQHAREHRAAVQQRLKLSCALCAAISWRRSTTHSRRSSETSCSSRRQPPTPRRVARGAREGSPPRWLGTPGARPR